MNFPSWFNGMSPSRSSPPSYFPSHRQQTTGISLWRSNRETLSKWVHLSHFRAISADILLSFASPAKWPLPPFLSITCAGGIYLYKSEYQWRHLFLFKCIYIYSSKLYFGDSRDLRDTRSRAAAAVTFYRQDSSAADWGWEEKMKKAKEEPEIWMILLDHYCYANF